MCNVIKYTYQTFNMLNFNLKEVKYDKIKSIGNEYYEGIDIFDAFANMKKLTILDIIYCNNCKCMTYCSSKEFIYNLPPVLIIVLNRGKNEQDFNEKFNFPEVLDFNKTDYVINEGSYKKYFLCGLIKYFGENSLSGHYISFFRNNLNEKFVMYNDTLVSENFEIFDVMEYNISNNNNEKVTPYILFFHFC